MKRNMKNKHSKSSFGAVENRDINNRENTKQKKKGRGLKIFIITAIILVVVAISATVGFVMWQNRDTVFTFSENVTISGVSVSELTYPQAKKKVEKYLDTFVKKTQLNIKAKEYNVTFTEKDFEYKFFLKKALKEAKVYSLKEQGKYEETTETEFVELEKPNFEVGYKVIDSSVSSNVKSFANKVNREYVNARVKKFVPFGKNRFIYKKAVSGYELLEDDLCEKIKEVLNAKIQQADIVAAVKIYEPEITVKDLKKNIVGLSQATSISYNTANGTENMRVALAACNGSVIEPGDVWSFNDCTGDSNLESNGYKPAQVISQQKLTQGIGGGICQASTTIFRAAAFANMTIYERYNHFWASSYAPAGEDATIDYPNLDLRLKNSTNYQMFMECKMEGTKLIVNIYGYQDPSYDNIKLYSKNHSIVNRKTYKTTTYRVLYLNGKVISEEVLCNSSYSLKGGVGVKSADSGSFRVMVDGTTKIEKSPVAKKPKKKPTEKATEETTAETTDSAADTTENTAEPESTENEDTEESSLSQENE